MAESCGVSGVYLDYSLLNKVHGNTLFQLARITARSTAYGDLHITWPAAQRASLTLRRQLPSHLEWINHWVHMIVRRILSSMTAAAANWQSNLGKELMSCAQGATL